MEGLLQPTHLIFILFVLLILVAPIFLLVRALLQRVNQGEEASRHQSQLLLSLEKINNTLERIENKLEQTRKGD